MDLRGFFNSLLGSKVNVRARYEFLREAISGTMSKFYMVRDRESRQTLGLKILDKEQTAALESRLKEVKKPPEGEIAMAFDHPRIVKTLEQGITTDDEQYLVMEFLEGPGMNSMIVGKSEKLSGNRLTLIRQAAKAVGAVHEAGYIHRDICPRNFVIDPEGKSLKLIDFGLTVPATPDFMKPGNRTGTPAYMAPEVVRRKPTDQRLDVFSLGVTFYELCTFELPWQGGTDGKAALAHSSVPPTPIEEYRPEIDPTLGKAIMRCLAVDPASRPASTEAFLEEIKSVRKAFSG